MSAKIIERRQADEALRQRAEDLEALHDIAQGLRQARSLGEMCAATPSTRTNCCRPSNTCRPALDIPYCHHEKWDGTGYPRGLKEEQIPFAARIFAVVDVWDALSSGRPYRPAWSE